jgi:hypothetical protein
LFKGYEILPHQFLDLQHNGRVWEYETGYLPNWQGFDLVGTPVPIPAFASGTTTYVDVPTAFVTLPTADDYLVKYTVYASQGSAIMPTKAGNDVKFVTDNTIGTFVEIVGSVSEIGHDVGGTINSYTRTFRVRTTRANQVVKMQLNSIIGSTTIYQSATQPSTIEYKRFLRIPAVAGTITTVTDNANGTTTINAGAGQVQDVIKQGSELAVTPLNNTSLDDNIVYTRTAGGLNVKVPRLEVLTVPAGTAPFIVPVSNAMEISLTYLTVANTPTITTFPAGQFIGQTLNVFNGNGGQAIFSNTNTDSPANITLNNQNGYIAVWSGFKWVRISNEQLTQVKKVRLVQPLTAGVNTITDNLGLLTPFARSVEVRDNATGQLIATSVITELTNTFTMSVAVAVSSARVTITG